METIKLPERLRVIAELVPKGAKAADIGTDHGYVPVFLSQTERCRRIIASDINEAPLQKAVELAREYGIENIEFRLTDGLTGFSPDEADTLIIAGMGGENIAEILSAAPWSLDCTLILQPMSKRERLALWLRQNGLAVKEEHLVKEKGGIHSVLLVGRGNDGDTSSAGLLVSRALCEKGDSLLEEHIARLVKKAEKTRIGLERSGDAEAKEKIFEQLSLIVELNRIAEEIRCRQ